jgi:hypothetical protein
MAELIVDGGELVVRLSAVDRNRSRRGQGAAPIRQDSRGARRRRGRGPWVSCRYGHSWVGGHRDLQLPRHQDFRRGSSRHPARCPGGSGGCSVRRRVAATPICAERVLKPLCSGARQNATLRTRSKRKAERGFRGRRRRPRRGRSSSVQVGKSLWPTPCAPFEEPAGQSSGRWPRTR